MLVLDNGIYVILTTLHTVTTPPNAKTSRIATFCVTRNVNDQIIRTGIASSTRSVTTA